MKKLVLVAVLAAATAAPSCGGGNGGPAEDPSAAPAGGSSPAAGGKQTRIHFTKNYNKGTGAGQYNTDCIGIVTTEMIGTERGTGIMWKVMPTNGENNDDACTGLTMTTVNLQFETDVMGAAAMKRLWANAGGVIQGQVSEADSDIGSALVHKYQVYIGDEPAGPDPVIIVDCADCGPGAGGPGE